MSRYYDATIAAFERLVQGGASIHRAVWGAGVSSREAAYHYVDDLILAVLPAGADQPTVVDLGCGLGASLTYLASRRSDLRVEGIMISSRQAARAAALTAEVCAGPRVAGSSSSATISSPRPVRPSIREPPDGWTTFRTGWRVASLVTVDQARTLAAGHGLVLARDVDLTSALELRRMRDRWVSVLVTLSRVVRPSGNHWRSLVGGDALQHRLIHGALSYRFLEFRQA